MSNQPASSRPLKRAPFKHRNASLRLRITTAHCPQVMLRVLDTLARQSVTPWVIAFSRRPRTQFIEVHADDLPNMATETLANRLESLVNVRSVQITRRDAAASR